MLCRFNAAWQLHMNSILQFRHLYRVFAKGLKTALEVMFGFAIELYCLLTSSRTSTWCYATDVVGVRWSGWGIIAKSCSALPFKRWHKLHPQKPNRRDVLYLILYTYDLLQSSCTYSLKLTYFIILLCCISPKEAANGRCHQANLVLDATNPWTSTGQSAFFDIAAWSLGASLGSLCRTGPRGWVMERWLLCDNFPDLLGSFYLPIQRSKDCNWTFVSGCEVDMLRHIMHKTTYTTNLVPRTNKINKMCWMILLQVCVQLLLQKSWCSVNVWRLTSGYATPLGEQVIQDANKIKTLTVVLRWVLLSLLHGATFQLTSCVCVWSGVYGCVLYIRYTYFTCRTCLQGLSGLN